MLCRRLLIHNLETLQVVVETAAEGTRSPLIVAGTPATQLSVGNIVAITPQNWRKAGTILSRLLVIMKRRGRHQNESRRRGTLSVVMIDGSHFPFMPTILRW